MPKEVTDPGLLKELNAGGGDDTLKELNRGADPVREYVGPFAKGVGQSLAGTANLGLDILETPYIGPVVKHLMPPAALLSEIPPEFRRGMEEFANAPSTSPAQTAGYYTGEAAQFAIPGGGGAAKLGLRGVASGVKGAVK